MFFLAFIIITSILCSLRLSVTAAAVPVASDGFIIPAELQQSNNDTHASNITGLNDLQSINAIQVGNSTDAAIELFRYAVPGTEYVLFVSDCSDSLDPTALKNVFTKGIADIESQIDQGHGAVQPAIYVASRNSISVEWYSARIYRDRCPYNDLVHLWKALRLVLFDNGERYPSWLYSRQCKNRVIRTGVSEGPEAAGDFVIKDYGVGGYSGW